MAETDITRPPAAGPIGKTVTELLLHRYVSGPVASNICNWALH